MSETDRIIHMWAAVSPWNSTVVLGGSLRLTRLSSSVCLLWCRGSPNDLPWHIPCYVACLEQQLGLFSLIYQDKCKHIKSQAHVARWLGTAYMSHSPSLVGTKPAYTILLSICCAASWIKSQHSPCVQLTTGLQLNLNVRGKRVSCGCQETSGQMSQHWCWQPPLSAC